MIKRVELDIKNGFFNIICGNSFEVSCPDAPFLVYEENNVWHVVSSPDTGKSCHATVTLPKNSYLEEFSLKIANGAVKVCEIDCGAAEIHITDSGAEFESIKARRIKATLGKGNAVINARPLVEASFNCGFGNMLVNLKKSKYKINSLCGAGVVTVNSHELPRSFESAENSGTKINIRCGLGKTEVRFI